ncbi:hypothetical protein HDU96_000217 [Phlyctochytrium bullatum]|nr:hypothetical protein HDU96_000217 [Phlyctochytrium bullatum]
MGKDKRAPTAEVASSVSNQGTPKLKPATPNSGSPGRTATPTKAPVAKVLEAEKQEAASKWTEEEDEGVVVIVEKSGLSVVQLLVLAVLSLLVGLQANTYIDTLAETKGISVLTHLTTLLFPGLAPPRPPTPVDAPVAPPALPRAFNHSHFETHFGLKYLPKSILDPVIAKYVEAHDLRTDDMYIDDAENIERYLQSLSWYLENPITDDERFEVRFVSQEKGYGLFANMDVGTGNVVVYYTGFITNNSISDYSWTYPSNITDENGEQIQLGIDSRFMGNWGRFVNHDENPNCEVVYLPYNNMWHVVYMSSRLIPKGSEVTVSYGDAYWESRTHYPLLSLNGTRRAGAEGEDEEEEEEEEEEEQEEEEAEEPSEVKEVKQVKQVKEPVVEVKETKEVKEKSGKASTEKKVMAKAGRKGKAKGKKAGAAGSKPVKPVAEDEE